MTEPTYIRACSRIIALLVALLLSGRAMLAQTTAFSYQGKLTDAGQLANATFDMQFKLFDAAINGTQIGSTITNPTVQAVNGVFTVTLDFGAAVFPGADRFLEINLRPAGNTGGYQQLLPRQRVTSSSYAVQALNAVTATAASGLTAAAGANLIQNTTALQTMANFNLSGNGTAGGTLGGNVVDTPAQYNLGGARILSNAGVNMLSLGANTGTFNTTQMDNTFIGAGAGQNTGTGAPGFPPIRNTFVGSQAGNANNDGQDNSFFGSQAGQANTSGFRNDFFGAKAGTSNTTAGQNSAFGSQAGRGNTAGQNNSFFGFDAGFNNTSGNNNSFFGEGAGENNQTGSNNTYIGFQAHPTEGQLDPNLDHATAIGANAEVNTSNSIVLGTTLQNIHVGIGVNAPTFKLHVVDTGATGVRVQTNTTGGKVASFYANGAFQIDAVNVPGGRFTILESGNVGIGSATPFDKLDVIGVIRVGTLGSGAGTTETLCRNGLNQISICSSSLRYKTNIAAFAPGLQLIQQLRPISFDWKQGGRRDVGFGAEEVARVNALFVTFNQQGEVEGVKYDRFATLFVNAFKEQQAQIETQQQVIRTQQTKIQQQRASLETQRAQTATHTQQLQAQIEAQQQQLTKQQQMIHDLRAFICQTNAQAAFCQEK